MPHHLLILAGQHVVESNLQRQLGIHMTPNEGSVFIVLLIVGAIALGVRRLFR